MQKVFNKLRRAAQKRAEKACKAAAGKAPGWGWMARIWLSIAGVAIAVANGESLGDAIIEGLIDSTPIVGDVATAADLVQLGAYLSTPTEQLIQEEMMNMLRSGGGTSGG